MGQGPLQRDKWLGCCGVILSHKTPKIPSSLNKPVPRGSKIVGETEREKKGRSSNHDWLVIIFCCISYVNYHFHVCCFSVRTETYSSVFVCCCEFLQAFFFSSCDRHPVSSCWAHRGKIYATLQSNHLLMWKQWYLPRQNISSQLPVLNLIPSPNKMTLSLVGK